MRPQLSPSLIGIVALVGSCMGGQALAGDGAVRKYSPAEFGAPDPLSLDAPPVEYRIGPLDKLSVAVLQLPDLPRDQQVDAAGKIHMPLIGDVQVQGMTARELETALKAKFGEKYLQAPEVQVVVTDALGDRVTVDGAVQQPGVYQLNGSRTLVQVLALARGPAENAATSRVAVFRTIKGQRMAAGFDLRKIRKGEQPDPVIYGRDVVVVDGSGVKSAYRTILSSIPLVALFGAI